MDESAFVVIGICWTQTPDVPHGRHTIAYVDVETGAELPEHAHFHEQVSNMLEGEFEFVLCGEKMLLYPGECLIIPSNVPHSGAHCLPHP